MISLRNVLKVNAMSSGATGLGLVAFSGVFASVFEVKQRLPFTAVGIFLLVFVGFVMLTALQKNINPRMVKVIVWLDSIWVMGSIVSLLLLNGTISLLGNILIVGVAVWVAAMAFLQNKGLKTDRKLVNPV